MAEETKPPSEPGTDLEALKKQLEETRKLKEDYLVGWQRERADFLNYKKEEMERLEILLEFSQTEIILKILPLLDNLCLAEKNQPADLKENEYVKGLLRIRPPFEAFLKEQGIEPIEALGQKFDPNFHEVVSEVEDKTRESGTIIEEIQKGYLSNNKLLRPTKVIIIK